MLGLAAPVVFSANFAMAGRVVETRLAPVKVKAVTTSSRAGAHAVPLLYLLAIAAAVSGAVGGGGVTPALPVD